MYIIIKCFFPPINSSIRPLVYLQKIFKLTRLPSTMYMSVNSFLSVF